MEIVNLKQTFSIHKTTLKVIKRFKSLTESRSPKYQPIAALQTCLTLGSAPAMCEQFVRLDCLQKFSRVAGVEIPDLFPGRRSASGNPGHVKIPSHFPHLKFIMNFIFRDISQGSASDKLTS